MPPARSPSDSNRLALISSSGERLISSGLRKTMTTPLGFESGPYDARAVQTTGTGSPPAIATDWSLIRGSGPLAERALSAGLSPGFPLWRSRSANTWSSGLPAIPAMGWQRRAF